MSHSVSSAQYRALAQFRYQIRCFLNFSERSARESGLEPQQYLLLLAVRGLPPGQPPSIRNLAERLQIRHHSVVELIDRMAEHGFVRRARAKKDRRQVLVRLTARGERVLARLAAQRLSELRSRGPLLVRALASVIAGANRQHQQDRRIRRAVRRISSP